MNLQSYIASGILELYVSGDLPKAEAEEVARMIEKHPELQEEVAAIEATLGVFAQVYHKEPSAGLLDSIMDRIEGVEPDVPLVPLNSPQNTSSEKTTSKTSFNWRILAIAASVAFLISIIFNLMQFQSLKTTQLALEETQSELIALNQQQQQLAEQIQRTNQQLDILRDPTNQVVDLAGLAPAPQFAARVYWDEKTEDVYLHSGNLTLPDLQKQFQLWAIVDEKPVSLGVFDLSEDVQQLQSLQIAGNVSAFAISLEPRGGSEAPTEVYLVGAV